MLGFELRTSGLLGSLSTTTASLSAQEMHFLYLIFIIVVLGVHCDIYKISYNIS
jgi:hypothetical protein